MTAFDPGAFSIVAVYRRFRPDGWPLCPRCGEDELYSLAIPATIETICGCYRCGPRPVMPPRVNPGLTTKES